VDGRARVDGGSRTQIDGTAIGEIGGRNPERGGGGPKRAREGEDTCDGFTVLTFVERSSTRELMQRGPTS